MSELTNKINKDKRLITKRKKGEKQRFWYEKDAFNTTF